MTYREFVTRIIIEGITELGIPADYSATEADCAGALAGYLACRECESAPELGILLAFARNKHAEVIAAPVPDATACVFAARFAQSVEWVCNCTSALLLNEGLQPLTRPTSRGIMKCSELLGAAPGGVPVEPQWFLDSPPAGSPDCLCSFCGCPIVVSQVLPLRAWDDRQLEIRACAKDACTLAFLSGACSVTMTSPS